MRALTGPVSMTLGQRLTMEERIHPTHKKTTNLIIGILVVAFLCVLSTSVFLGVRESEHWETALWILIPLGMLVFVSLTAWMFFRWMWCKCPECGRWLRIPKWNRPAVLKVDCKECDIRWNTNYEGPSCDDLP